MKNNKDFIVNVTAEPAGIGTRPEGEIAVICMGDVQPTYIYTVEDADKIKDVRLKAQAKVLFGQNPAPNRLLVCGLDQLSSDLPFTIAVATNSNMIDKIADSYPDKIFFETVRSTSEAEAYKENRHDNVFVVACTEGEAGAALAAIMSHRLGSKTAKFKTLKHVGAGVHEEVLDLSGFEDANIATYETVMGVDQITGSKLNGGEYLDVELGRIYIKEQLERRLMNVALKNDKIPYNNRGIGMLVGAVNEVLQEAQERDIISEFVVNYKDASDVDTIDKQNRVYNDIHAVAQLVGAIEGGEFNIFLQYDEVIK